MIVRSYHSVRQVGAEHVHINPKTLFIATLSRFFRSDFPKNEIGLVRT